MLQKVIIFIPAIEKGGVERNAIWVSNELAKRGYEVDVVFVRSEEGQLKKFHPLVHCVKMQYKRIPALNQRLSDKMSDRCNSVIIFSCKSCHTIFLCICDHTSEFYDLIHFVIDGTTALSEENRSSVIYLDRNCRYQNDR